MTDPQKHIEQLEKIAIERELVAQLTPNKDTRRLNEQRAGTLRKRIGVLNARLNRLTKDHPEKVVT